MKFISLISTTVLTLILLGTSYASTSIELEHNQAKKLVSQGKILSLDLTLVHVQQYCAGKLIDAHLYQAQGRWSYDLRLKTLEGELVSLSIDAATGQLQSDQQLPLICYDTHSK